LTDAAAQRQPPPSPRWWCCTTQSHPRPALRRGPCAPSAWGRGPARGGPAHNPAGTRCMLAGSQRPLRHCTRRTAAPTRHSAACATCEIVGQPCGRHRRCAPGERAVGRSPPTQRRAEHQPRRRCLGGGSRTVTSLRSGRFRPPPNGQGRRHLLTQRRRGHKLHRLVQRARQHTQRAQPALRHFQRRGAQPAGCSRWQLGGVGPCRGRWCMARQNAFCTSGTGAWSHVQPSNRTWYSRMLGGSSAGSLDMVAGTVGSNRAPFAVIRCPTTASLFSRTANVATTGLALLLLQLRCRHVPWLGERRGRVRARLDGGRPQ
jgi:hypothetical protein